MELQAVFGSNLKYYREKQRMTQRQLAEIIGYTEKSVSKWENGGGMPTLSMALQLAAVLGVSLDELLQERSNKRYYLGIDGGGTKTVFRLAGEDGREIRTVYKAASNPNDIGMEKAQELLREGIYESCRGIPIAQVTMYAGISGGGLTGSNAEVLRDFFSAFGFFAFQNGSDIENLAALADRNPCILAIMGTGFIVYGVSGETRRRIAGWGQFFDDGGSGYTLGRDAVAAALWAEDGTGEPTLLSALLQEKTGQSAQAHLAEFYRKGKRYIAEFAEIVFAAAEKGDRTALAILERNMAYAARAIDAAARAMDAPGSIPVFFSGGVSRRYQVLFPLIQKYLKTECQLIYITDEPVNGALKRAQSLQKRG